MGIPMESRCIQLCGSFIISQKILFVNPKFSKLGFSLFFSFSLTFYLFYCII